MTATSPKTTNTPDGAARTGGDVCQSLRDAAASANDANAYVTAILPLLAQRFDAVYGLAQMESATGAREYEYALTKTPAPEWNKLASVLLLEARYHNIGKARLGSGGATDGHAVLSVPLSLGDQEPNGAVALVIADQGKGVTQAKLGEFKALVSLASSLYRPAAVRPAAPVNAESRAAQTLTKAAGYDSLRHFAFGVVNSLKTRTGCEQVALGFVRGTSVSVECISGLDDVAARSPGVREIQQAMEECLDARQPLGWQRAGQPLETTTPAGQLLHKQWSQHIGGASVASLPLVYDGQVVAVASFRADAKERISPETIAEWNGLLAPLAAPLVLLQRAERGLLRHTVDRARESWRKLRRAPVFKKCLYAALVPAIGWLLLGRTTYVVTVPCQIVPAEERRIAAPFEGSLASSNVLPGERVKAGQVLARFDTRELALKRDKLAAELRNCELELTSALQRQDTVAAGMLGAQAEMLRAELGLIAYRLERATITAPCDGTILDGDLRRRIGEVVPLGEPLFTLAAGDRCAVELQAPEHAAAFLKTGQVGKFTTLAQPDEGGELRVRNVEPLAQVTAGGNVFLAEAEVANPPEWMRVGMSGVARVETERRPVWWTMLHRAIDAVRMQWWKL